MAAPGDKDPVLTENQANSLMHHHGKSDPTHYKGGPASVVIGAAAKHTLQQAAKAHKTDFTSIKELEATADLKELVQKYPDAARKEVGVLQAAGNGHSHDKEVQLIQQLLQEAGVKPTAVTAPATPTSGSHLPVVGGLTGGLTGGGSSKDR
jgi:poly(3-hydroxybutyrate) depolymerase